MSQPTRGEIIEAQLARQWAERNKSCEVSTLEIQAAANFILAHTTPPTMADVEWDDDKHYLAEAEQAILGKVVMLGPNEDGFINFCFLSHRESKYDAAYPSTLTPTGKRYTLTEVETHAS